LQQYLIDGIELTNSTIFKKTTPKIHTYLNEFKYQNLLIEHININELLNDEYRDRFFVFLNDLQSESEYDISHPRWLVILLMLRIEQLQDSKAFYILTESIKNELISFNGIDMFILEFVRLFLSNRIFFIKQAVKYKDTKLLDLAMTNIRILLIEEYFFIKHEAKIILKKGQLFSYPTILDDLKKSNTSDQEQSDLLLVSVYFLSDKYSQEDILNEWMQGMVEIPIPNLSNYWKEDLIKQLSAEEKVIYDKHIYPVIKNYIIRNYHINSEIGYTNLNIEPNNDSRILTIIPNNEYVCFLNDDERDENWVKVYYQKTDMQGYIHKSYLSEI